RALEDLCEPASWPSDFELLDDACLAQADVGTKARSAEAAAAADGSIDLARVALFVDADTNSRTQREAVRQRADQIELDPVVAVSRILEERRPEAVRGVCAANHLDHVLVAIVVDVAERDAVALLQVTESA